ncbi:MAG: hypothetical protein HC932_02630 [Thermales bacterium]|nr:hypothetical protein [Thermales bacterium]
MTKDIKLISPDLVRVYFTLSANLSIIMYNNYKNMQEVYTPKIETKPKIEINIIDRSFLSDIRFKIKHFEDLIKPVIIRADTDKNIPPKSEYLGQAHLNAVMNGEEFNYLFYQELANDVGVINYLDFINEDKAPYYLKKYTQLKKKPTTRS